MAETQSNVDAVLKQLEAKLTKAAEVIGGKAEGYAKMLCPFDTGRLRGSIVHAIPGQVLNKQYKNRFGEVVGEYNGALPPDASGEKFVVTIGSNVEYAPYIELGTHKPRREPHPYLRPAIEDHLQEYKAVLMQILKE